MSTALLCGFFVFFPLTNSDIWWHLAAGREMLHTGDFLRLDPFAYSKTLPWIDLHWLFQLGSFALYSVFGPWGLVLAKVVLTGLTAAILIVALPGRRIAPVSLFVAGIAFYEMRFLVLARPTVITTLCVALFLLVLERFVAGAKPKVLFWLVPIQLLWTNAQGLFLLGPVIVGMYAIGWLLQPEQKRSNARSIGGIHHRGVVLAATSVFLVVAAIVNPWGVRGLLLPIRLLGRIEPSLKNLYSLNVSENVPLLLLSGPESRLAVVTLLGALICAVLFFLSRARVRLEHILVAGAFFGLALMAHRNVTLFLSVAIALICAYAPLVPWQFAGLSRVAGAAVACCLVVLGMHFFAHIQMLRAAPVQSMISPFRYPDKATAFLKEHPFEGEMFNSVRYGGYLIWELFPGRKVFIDGRLIIRTPHFFARYLNVLDNPDQFDSLAAQAKIGAVVLMTSYNQRYWPLAKELYHNNEWKLVYIDEGSVIYYRLGHLAAPSISLDDSTRVAMLAQKTAQRWNRWPLVARQSQDQLMAVAGYLRQ